MEEMSSESSSRKSYTRLSYDFMLEEEGYGTGLFHTYCKVRERACATTIDHDSSINVVGIDMVEKLKLSTTPHPRPYSLRRCHDKLDITHQTLVSFSIGKFSCDVLCDMIPVPLVSCHLVLGELWYKNNGAAYDRCANTYTLTQDKVYVLHPMEKKLFRSWRKERLLKMKEQKEASKREAEHDIIFSTPVQSEDGDVALKTSSKLRTVSFEEGEDDAASRSIFIHVAMRQDIFSWKRNNKHEDELDINVPHGVGYVQAAQWYVHATRKINQGNNMMPCDEEPDTFGIKWCIDLGDRNKIERNMPERQ
jgi:hypothetical protein